MWYYTSYGKQYGPCTPREVLYQINSGCLSETDKVRRVDSNEWLDAKFAAHLISNDRDSVSSNELAPNYEGRAELSQKGAQGIVAVGYLIKGTFFLIMSFFCAYGTYSVSKDTIEIARSGVATTGTVISSEFHSQRKGRRVDREYWVEISYNNHNKKFHLQNDMQPGSSIGIVYSKARPDNAIISNVAPSIISSVRGMGYTPLIGLFMFLGFLIYSIILFGDAKKLALSSAT